MNISTSEIRKIFIDFFHTKNHQVITSSSLIPENDLTLLFTNAGMNQFKNAFLYPDEYIYSRVTTVQRCIRAGGKHNDLDHVGYTTRHHTFFEMLGNFSFGNYFKYEAINYAWELLTSKNYFNLSKDKLLVTVYQNDDETFNIWNKNIGIPIKRIIRIGNNKKGNFNSDNFWNMGNIGPCGPCTEIFYDYGDQIVNIPDHGHKINNNRYIEIWNIVFMQFNRQSNGCMLPLPKPSVDTGMGLERIASVLQNVYSNYDIDIFRMLISATAQITHTLDLNNKSLCVIADHIRSCAFLISDGIIPSNEGRGYVLRRIIRRAIRHGNMLGVKKAFFYKLVSPLIQIMGIISNKLQSNQSLIEKVLKIEEEQFINTLDRGLRLLYHELKNVKNKTLDGNTIFRLYDTYGFPFDLTRDICREKEIKIDEFSFNQAMQIQKKRTRKFSCFKRKSYEDIISINTKSYFTGYDHKEEKSTVIALFRNNKEVYQIHAGEEAVVILDKTPFYPESGGQVGDKGFLKTIRTKFLVNNTKKYGKAIFHHGKVLKGTLKIKDYIHAKINVQHRNYICLNHSATHLLHAALRKILGNQVTQKGSLINEKYLRFDFLYFKVVTSEHIQKIENLINQQIRYNFLIKTNLMTLNDAIKKGAMALFHKKYDKNVRVLTIGNFSTELCVGTHAKCTGDIGLFHILSEHSTAAGIRRIEAVTGTSAIRILNEKSNLLKRISSLMHTNYDNLIDNVRKTLNRVRILEKKFQQEQNQQAIKASSYLSSQVKIVSGINLLVSNLTNIESKMLRIMVDNLKNKLGSSIIILSSIIDNKINLIASVTQDLTDRIQAKELIHVISKKIAGKGGGSSEIAQAGGTDIIALPSALNSIESWIILKLSI
ncbi:Alanine--tRNA ligase [Candidatus Ecksteinia adelgidicola]|nr:Alanine--tRNA ligase [Candidatus Ecksteinia adelgidicola]